MNDARSEIWAVAVHEAGHAVAVWCLGGTVIGVWAGTLSQGGNCSFEDGVLTHGFGRVVVSHAGPEAARRLAWMPPGTDAGDIEIARRAEPDANRRLQAIATAEVLIARYAPAVRTVALLLADRGSLSGSEVVAAISAALPLCRGHSRV